MKVRIIGCGEAFDERFPNNSTLIEGASSTLLCDCGYAVAPALWRAGYTGDAIDAIYISHAHADHYFGLPTLMARMWEDGRTKPLTVVSQPNVIAMAEEAMELAYRTLSKRYQFRIRWVEAAGDLEVGGFGLAFAPTLHSMSNLMVCVREGGTSVCYSGDGQFTRESRELVHGADLVIHEAYQMTPSPVHGDIPGVLAMAREEQVKELALVHVQRDLRANQRELIDDAMSGSGIRVSMPEPGVSWAF